MRSVIVLNGPIGVGKTTLGRALARELGGAFVDSDDLRDHAKRWVEEVLSLTNALVRAGMAALASRPNPGHRHAAPRARLGAPARARSAPRGWPPSASPWLPTRVPSWTRPAAARSAQRSGAGSPR